MGVLSCFWPVVRKLSFVLDVLSLRYSNGDVKQPGGYMNVNFREEVQTEDIHLVVISIVM